MIVRAMYAVDDQLYAVWLRIEGEPATVQHFRGPEQIEDRGYVARLVRKTAPCGRRKAVPDGRAANHR